MINLHDQMNMLMKKRTIFHSEADFQFALAWEIQKAYPDANVRLEYCPAKYPNMHLDMLVKIGEMGFPIELKYKTLMTQMEVDGEYYNLKNHGAQDLGRYDYLIDVERIELLKNTISTFEKVMQLCFQTIHHIGLFQEAQRKLFVTHIESMRDVKRAAP